MANKIANINFVKTMAENIGLACSQSFLDLGENKCPEYEVLTEEGIIEEGILNIDESRIAYISTQLVEERDITIEKVTPMLTSFIDVYYNPQSTADPMKLFSKSHTPLLLEIEDEKVDISEGNIGWDYNEGYFSYIFDDKDKTYKVRQYYEPTKTAFSTGLIGTPTWVMDIDVTNLNTYKATSFAGFFGECDKITKIEGLGKLSTDNVINMGYLFTNCNNLTDIDGLANWNTKELKNMRQILYYCKKITSLEPIRNWNTSNLTDMGGSFQGCESLTSVEPIENWDVSNVTQLGFTFGGCYNLKGVDFINWYPKPTTVSGLLYRTSQLTYARNFQNFNTDNLVKVSSLINDSSTKNSRKIVEITGLENWNVYNVEDDENGNSGIYGIVKTDGAQWGWGAEAGYPKVIDLRGWKCGPKAKIQTLFYGHKNCEIYLNNLICPETKGIVGDNSFFSYNSGNSVLVHCDDWNPPTDRTLEPIGSYCVCVNVTCKRKNKDKVLSLFNVIYNDKYPFIVDPVTISNIEYENVVSADTTSVEIKYDGNTWFVEYHQRQNVEGAPAGNATDVIEAGRSIVDTQHLTHIVEFEPNTSEDPIVHTGTVTWEGESFNYSITQKGVANSYIDFVYDITDTSKVITLYDDNNIPTSMKIDGVEEDVESTYSFDTVGEHQVRLYYPLDKQSFNKIVASPDDVISVDVTHLDTSSATSLNGMFNMLHYVGNTPKGNYTLTEIIGIEDIDTGNVTDMNSMFTWCKVLENIDISGWDTKNLQKCTSMFQGCNNLKNVGNLGNWNTDSFSGKGPRFMFQSCGNLEYIGDLSGWNLSKVTDLSFMFEGCGKLTDIGDISNWDVSGLTPKTVEVSDTGLKRTFYGAGMRNLGDLSKWTINKNVELNETFTECQCQTMGIIPIYRLDETSVNGCIQSPFINCKQLTDVINCGKLSNTISFESSPLTLESGLKIIDALDEAQSGQTLKLSSYTKNLLNVGGYNASAMVAAKGWSLA